MDRNDTQMPEAVARFADDVEAMRVRAHVCLDLALDLIYLIKASPDAKSPTEGVVELSTEPLEKAMINRVGKALTASNFDFIMTSLQLELFDMREPLSTCDAWGWAHKLEHALYDEV